MTSLRPFLPLSIAALAAMVGALCGEISSGNHPVLQRALTEEPAADRDGNGVLSLAEYEVLQTLPRKKGPQQPAKIPFLPVLPDGDVVIADFEDNPIRRAQGGEMQGPAFERNLEIGTRLLRKRVGSYRGRFFLTTMANSDAETGSLTSPEFLIEQDYLLITMSGGDFPLRVGVNLRLGDEIVRSATGGNDDYFERVAFDLREFRGRIATIELLDEERGLWGHLNVDRIVMSAHPGEARIVDAKPPAATPRAGFAITSGGYLRGGITVQEGKLATSHGAIAAGDLLLALNFPDDFPTKPSGALRLINGEIWQGHVGDLEDGNLWIGNNILGRLEIPLARIASIEFVPAGTTARREAGHLYRTSGEPIPGKLIWVRQKDIAIDCPLGVVPIPRENIQRFVLATPRAAPQSADELHLTDGSVLSGTIDFAGTQLALNHDVLGEVKLDWSAIRSLRRGGSDLQWLDQLPMTVVEQIGPALPPPAPQILEGRDGTHLRAIRIFPRTVVRFPLKPAADASTFFRAQLAAVPGAAVPVAVTMAAGEAVLWEQTLAPTTEPLDLFLSLPAANELTITVAFDGALAFPCGIELRDAHFRVNSGLTPQPQPANAN